MIEDKKQGSIDHIERIDLIEQFIKCFGKDRIECVIGDSKFIGKNWYLISSLNKNNSTNASSPMGLTKDGKLYAVWSEMSNTSQIRVRSVKDIQTIDSWLDGGGTTGINKNTDHYAKNPVILENLSVFYAAWSEENSTTSDNVSQIRVKKLDRSDNDSNTQWLSLSGENDVKGLNYNSNFSADHPQLIFHNSKLYIAWQEANLSLIHI